MRTRALMEELRRELDSTPPVSPAGASPRSTSPGAAPRLPAPPSPRDAAFLEKLKASTVAQIGVGRAGTRLRTATYLKWLGDRAVAVEAVRSELPADFAARLGAVAVASEARDLDEFLLRPDLGRRLSEESLALLRSRCAPGPDVQVVVGPGLSANAVALNAPPLLEALGPELARVGLRAGTTVLVERCRMRTLSVVGEALGAKTAVILLGERPGLGTGDGMSAYLVHRPRREAVESDHEVIWNIHARGTPPAEAARKLALLLAEFVRVGASGVARTAGAPASPDGPAEPAPLTPSAVERARVEPSRANDALLRRELYSTKRLGERRAPALAGSRP